MPDRGSGVGGITQPSSHSGRRMNEKETNNAATGNNVDETIQNIRVCLRFRPMNMLEKNRRSRNCVEVHPPGIYGSTELTVDSPLEGEYDFNFDQVFEGDASQSAVYEHAGAPLAKKLVEGRNCALIAYGQSGSGKTHTMMGDQFEDNEKEVDVDQSESTNLETEIDDKMRKGMDENSGIIPRITKDIFAEMDNSSASIEFTVRVSYIEIYLEQIRDLLNPSNHFLKIIDSPSLLTSRRLIQNSKNRKETMHIESLSELCCIDNNDVISLLARGNAYRRISEQKNKTDFKQSHTIFMLKIEQKDTITKNEIVSKLHLVDMAGSESEGKGQKKVKKKGKPGSAVYQLETRIINRAHSALGNVLKTLADNKQKHHSNNSSLPLSLPKQVPYRESKLTTILKDAFGGNCLTAFVLSASPASFNISATIATMRLGQKCRRIQNNPAINMVSNPQELNVELDLFRKREYELLRLMGTVAGECQRFKAETIDPQSVAKPSSEDILDSLGEILNRQQHLLAKNGLSSNYNTNQTDSRKIRDSSLREDLMKKGMEISSLTKQLDEAKKARDRVHNLMLEIQAECAVLRTESDTVLAAKKKNTFDLIDAQNEIQDLCQRKLEVEHNLRTSQFRETEATVFLRHFRRFYKKLLQSQATKGSGGMSDVISSVPGVPNLKDMIGLDSFLAVSGLIELEEVDNDDISESYRPSVPALLRSSSSAKQAHNFAVELTKISQERNQHQSKEKEPKKNEPTRSNMGHSAESLSTKSTKSTKNSSSTSSSSGGDGTKSKPSKSEKNTRFLETTETIKNSGPTSSTSDRTLTSSLPKNLSERVMELHTPAGLATKIRQEQLEDDLSRMSRICIELQIALNEEREQNEVLSSQQGARAKRRLAEETISTRRELKKKEHDMQAIIWKMNELHLINKTYNERLSSREQLVMYLEESLAALNQRGVEVAATHRESDRKSREQIAQLQSLLRTMTRPIWQYGETGGNRALESRMMIPIQGGNRDIVDDTASFQGGQGEVQEENIGEGVPSSFPFSQRPLSGPSLDISNASSLRTSASVDIRAGTPPNYPTFGGRNKNTDNSEAGLSYSTPGYSSVSSSAFMDNKPNFDTESDVSENAIIRSGTMDGEIPLTPLVEEMTLIAGNGTSDDRSDGMSDNRSMEFKMMMEDNGGVRTPTPEPIPFGGQTNDFIPRRFNKKYGPLVKAGVLKPSNRLNEQFHNYNFFRGASRGSATSSLSTPEIKTDVVHVK